MQMVWADTTDVGCAAVRCPFIKAYGWKNSLLLICNYGPALALFSNILLPIQSNLIKSFV